MGNFYDTVAELNSSLGSESILIEAVKSHAISVLRNRLSVDRQRAIDDVNKTFDSIIEETAREMQATINGVYKSNEYNNIVINLSINGGPAKKLKTKQVLIEVPDTD